MSDIILPLGVTDKDLERCSKIVYELTGSKNTTENAIKLLNIVYSKGGDYSTDTLLAFAKAYL